MKKVVLKFIDPQVEDEVSYLWGKGRHVEKDEHYW
jgi:hypothetical protein